MQAWIIAIMDQFGYLGIAVLSALENLFPPIPSEVVLTFGGFMTTYTTMEVWLVIAAATAGTLLGSAALYGIGRFLEPRRLKSFLNGRLGRLLGLSPSDIDNAMAWFQKKGGKAVFFCRFIPIVRSLISLPAGSAKMKMGSFLLLTALGSVIWNTALVWLGAWTGASWNKIVVYMDRYTSLAVIAILVIVLLCAARFIKKRFLTD